MEAREPLAKVKEITPMTIIKEQKTHSTEFLPETSPYPTVVIVVIVQ